MLKIKIIAMGKLTEAYTKEAAAEFIKRMGKSFQVTVTEPKPENLPMNPTDGEIAKEEKITVKTIDNAIITLLILNLFISYSSLFFC